MGKVGRRSSTTWWLSSPLHTAFASEIQTLCKSFARSDGCHTHNQRDEVGSQVWSFLGFLAVAREESQSPSWLKPHARD